MGQKLAAGLAQQFSRLEGTDDPKTLMAVLGKGESRFREGDRLCVHDCSALSDDAVHNVVFDCEGTNFWTLRCRSVADARALLALDPVYAEQDSVDLSGRFLSALADIAGAADPENTLLALIQGDVPLRFNPEELEDYYRLALAHGLNPLQAEAVGKALSCEHVACIQGPPGTGKTQVLALAAALMVARGETVLVTSHTHNAINNALNKVAAKGVPVAKIGSPTTRRGLDEQLECVEKLADWGSRPSRGYVIGATPFACCSARLPECTFDTIIFDEASQVTVPLALLAMRAGKRFIFIGDQQQLPPVVLSQSILSRSASVFSRLTAHNADSVMLRETYRMNRWLTEWPSRNFYGGELQASGPNADRRLDIAPGGDSFAASLLKVPESAIFVPTRDSAARSRNVADAALVVDLCVAAREGGLTLKEIGIVTPYRAQGHAIRTLLKRTFGEQARQVVADTVERMQGQERELIILSLATGSLDYLGAVAEFFFQPERLNVSITRAMTKLVIIGPELPQEFRHNIDHVAAGIGLYRDLVDSCRRMAPNPDRA
jgi:DNA replication ATP-dependent helicase Dna2